MLKRFAAFTLAVPLMAGGMCFAAEKTVKTETKMTENQTDKIMHQRLSEYMKKDVYNAAGNDIGNIKDVVLDGNTHHVSYVVVSYGGMMGVGDKLFAVPWHALEMKGTESDKLTINIPEETLKNAPGFDDKKWPDMADANFRKEVDAFYTKNGMKVPEPKTAEKPSLVTKNEDTSSKGLLWCRRASQFIGADVHNKANEDIGDINDLVVDARTGKVMYAVLSYGGVMGVGDKLFAIPMDSIGSKADDNKLLVDMGKDHLKNAPGFNKDNWPDFADASYRKTVNDYHRGDKKDAEAKNPMD
jgi:sporulation protein YlmC with PRC-barrel domain